MTSLQGLNVLNQGSQAIDAFSRGDYAGGLKNLAGAGFGSIGLPSGLRGMGQFFGAARGGAGSMWRYLQSCFVAGTPLRTPDGSKPIEEFKSYEEHGDDCDYVLSRNEFDPSGRIEAKRVLRRFERVSPILNLHVGGRVIGTTAEHPFYVENEGWVELTGLKTGDRILLENNEWLRVEGVADSGQIAMVYNVEVEGEHTYFVGDAYWGWAVWAHNVTLCTGRGTSVLTGRDKQNYDSGFDRIFNRPPQVTINQQVGRSFQQQATLAFGATPNTTPMPSMTLAGRPYTTIPDGRMQNGALLEVKAGIYVSYSRQLQGQIWLGQSGNGNFLVVGPGTTVSGPTISAFGHSPANPTIFRFDPATGTFTPY